MTAATVLQNMCSEIGRKTSSWTSINCNSGSRGSVGLQAIQQQTLEFLDATWGSSMLPGAVCSLAGLADAEMYRPIDPLFEQAGPVEIDGSVFNNVRAKALLHRSFVSLFVRKLHH